MEIIIKNLWFDPDQYFNAEYEKNQIVIHFTASPSSKYTSNNGILGDINHWRLNKERVATCSIIGSEGIVYKLFDSSKWAHHLGVPSSTFKKFELQNINTYLNKHSIGIELDNLGPLKYSNGVFRPAASYLRNSNYIVKEEDVIHYPNKYRGYEYYEAFTDSQISTLKVLLKNLASVYNISLKYNENMWEVNPQALGGANGIWSHTSFRFDKTDAHPDPKLIIMLKNLSEKTIETNGKTIYQPDKPMVFTEVYQKQLEFQRAMDQLLSLNRIQDHKVNINTNN